MLRKWFILCLLLILPVLAAADDKKVYFSGETAPFPEDAQVMRILVFPLQGADGMLLSLDDDALLVDGGVDTQADIVFDTAKEYGCSRVHRAFNTHPHNDHIGSIPKLLEKGFEIDQFITVFPLDYSESDSMQIKVLGELKKKGIPIIQMKNGDEIPFGEAKITIVQQTGMGGTNSKSGMLYIRYRNASILLTGDVEGDAQRLFADKYDLKADILKVPHHGVSLIETEFLENVDPEFAVITNGSINTEDVQEELMKAGIPFYFATWGPILLETDGEKWIVDQKRFPERGKYIERYIRDFERRKQKKKLNIESWF